MKRMAFISALLIFSAGTVLAIDAALTAGTAQAGGFSDRSEAETIRKRQENQIRFIWRLWSKPFWQDGLICREFKGNFVCLSPQQAEQYRWPRP